MPAAASPTAVVLRSRALTLVLVLVVSVLAACRTAEPQTATSEPATTEPATTEPATTEPPTTEPTTIEPRPTGRLLVFAAASLTESFTALADEAERRWPGTTIDVSFAGSPTLVTQIRNGAPAGVVALADEANMARLEQAGDVEPPLLFAGNELAIVVRRTNPRGITALADLNRPGLLVGLGGPAVPAGAYAREAFAKAGLPVPDASQEQDVKAIVAKVVLGELDAGIVYVTDVRAGGDQVLAVPIPEAFNVAAAYPIAVVADASNPALARAFVAFVRSADGQRVLRGFGFRPPR